MDIIAPLKADSLLTVTAEGEANTRCMSQPLARFDASQGDPPFDT